MQSMPFLGGLGACPRKLLKIRCSEIKSETAFAERSDDMYLIKQKLMYIANS